jgi:hypothetical protein
MTVAVVALAKPKDNPWYTRLHEAYLGKILWDGGLSASLPFNTMPTKGGMYFLAEKRLQNQCTKLMVEPFSSILGTKQQWRMVPRNYLNPQKLVSPWRNTVMAMTLSPSSLPLWISATPISCSAKPANLLHAQQRANTASPPPPKKPPWLLHPPPFANAANRPPYKRPRRHPFDPVNAVAVNLNFNLNRR